MTAQKVSPEQIAALMKRVTVTTEYSEAPTPHVTAKAWLDGSFHLATAISKAVNPAEFRRDLGEEYSTNEALDKAGDKLWELEGYVLFQQKENILQNIGNLKITVEGGYGTGKSLITSRIMGMLPESHEHKLDVTAFTETLTIKQK